MNAVQHSQSVPACLYEDFSVTLSDRRYNIPTKEADIIAFPGGTVHVEQGQVVYDNGDTAEIFGKELELFVYLARNAGRTVTRNELLQQVWQMNPQNIITRTVDMHVAKLRDKLRDDPHRPNLLLTVRGKGYQLVIDSPLATIIRFEHTDLVDSSEPEAAVCCS